jgi:hypothetical protein
MVGELQGRGITVSASPQFDLSPPSGWPATATQTDPRTVTVKRRDRLGGLIHEDKRAA